jgi:AcrR family transcriptional regulator
VDVSTQPQPPLGDEGHGRDPAAATGRHGDDEDPRKARSRARLLDAATALLAKGGAGAVTIDAVTGLARVARATLYRHFAGGEELVAAAFARMLPPIPPVPDGDLRDQLVALVVAQARILDEIPIPLTAMCWMGLGPGLGDYSSAEALNNERPELLSLRERLVERYREAFDRVFDTPAVREALGDFDYDLALAQLLGPVVFTKLATLPSLDHAACERVVDDFLTARGFRPVTNGPRAVPMAAIDESP